MHLFGVPKLLSGDDFETTTRPALDIFASMATAKGPAQRLPPEILDLILPTQPPSLDFALSPADPLATTLPDTLEYYASLRSAALVCRAWYRGTVPHLWRNVTIWRGGQIASMLKTPSASARLQDTRHLRVLWDVSTFSSSKRRRSYA